MESFRISDRDLGEAGVSYELGGQLPLERALRLAAEALQLVWLSQLGRGV